MDLEEWEVLPDDGYLEINYDGDKKIYSRKYISNSNSSVFHDYFSCSAPNPTQFVDSTIVAPHPRVPKQIIPLQIQLEPKIHDHEVTKEVITTQEVPFEINMLPSTICEQIKTPLAMTLDTEQDQVSQVFFKKMIKENESSRVLSQDMRVESPKSSNKTFAPQIDAAAPFQYEENITSEVDKENNMVIKKLDIEDNRGGLKVLNWSLTGIGAICSFGVAAAATICIVFIGNRQKNKQNQRLRFQIFSDDKRMKQAVHHASKLNDAISAARGVPMTRAHITVGGYYDAF